MKRLQTRNFRKLTDKLKQARKAAALSQADAARLMGVTQSYISKAEAGLLRVDIVALRRFAGLYKVDLAYFFDGAEKAFSPAVPAVPSADTFFNGLARGALVFNDVGLIVQVNAALLKMLGWEKADLIGKMGSELMKGDTAARVLKLLRSAEISDCIIPDAELLRKDGKTFLSDLDVSSTFDDHGYCTGGVLFVMPAGVLERERDILRASSRLIDESVDAIILLQDGIIKYANKAATSMSGYGEEELLGMDFLTLITPDLRQELAHRHALRIKGAKLPATLETRIQLKNGKHLDVELVLGNLLYKGRIAYTVVARDIAKRKMSEDETRYRFEAVSRENEDKESFLRDLGKSLGDAGSILSGPHLTPESVRSVSDRINAAVAEIAVRSRHGKQGDGVADFSPHDIIAWAVKRIKHTSGTGKRLSIRIATAPDLPLTLRGLGRQAMAVTANLARNAAARTRDSAIEIRAEYLPKSGDSGGQLFFEITSFNDTTPQPEIKKTIETGQMHPANPYLSLAVYVAQANAFELETDKTATGDRVYRLVVPAEPGRAPAFVRKPRLPEAKSFAVGETPVFPHSVRIIVVHPDVGFMESFAPVLEASGAQADFFQNASDAMAEVLRGETDIVVLNEDMQGLTSSEAAGFLRRTLKKPPIMVVLDSGFDTSPAEAALYDLKLAKPVSAAEIATACLTAFNARKSA